MTRREALEKGAKIARAAQRTVDVCYYQHRAKRFYFVKFSTDPLRDGHFCFGSIHCDGRFKKGEQ